MGILQKISSLFNNQSVFDRPSAVQRVAVFGFADARPGSRLYKDAYDVSQALAKSGYVVVDGGGPGVMEAATLGAKSVGGHVVGVTLYPKDSKNFEGRDLNNPIDEEIKTNTYVERTLTLMKEGQVYVVFNGASGTISEFGMAWGLARIYFGHHKPLILYGNFWKKIMKVLKQNLMVRPEESKVYKIVNSPEGVLKAIKEFEWEIEQGWHKELKVSREEGFAFS